MEGGKRRKRGCSACVRGRDELLRSQFSFCSSLLWHFQADLIFTVSAESGYNIVNMNISVWIKWVSSSESCALKGIREQHHTIAVCGFAPLFCKVL